MCSARLISLIDSANKAAAAQASNPTVNPKKQSKTKKRKAAELADPTAAAEVAAGSVSGAAAAAALNGVQARAESAFLTEVVGFVSKVQSTSGVSLAVGLPAEVDEALSKLRECEALAANKLEAGASGEYSPHFHQYVRTRLLAQQQSVHV